MRLGVGVTCGVGGSAHRPNSVVGDVVESGFVAALTRSRTMPSARVSGVVLSSCATQPSNPVLLHHPATPGCEGRIRRA